MTQRDEDHERRDPFYVWLAPGTGAAIAKACRLAPQSPADAGIGRRVRVQAREIDLGKTIVVLTLDKEGSCAEREVRVRATAVLATETRAGEKKPSSEGT